MMGTLGKPLLISIVGPTAVGKTSVAIELARWLQTEIVSADSRQFYKEMSIGTAKPTEEELQMTAHHFVNSHSIQSIYSAGEFGRDALRKIEEIHAEKKCVLAVGGSGLYLKALWEGFDDMPKVNPEIRKELNEEFSARGLQPLLDELKVMDLDYYEKVDRNNGQRIIRALEVIRETGRPFSSFRKNENVSTPYENLKIGLNMEREILFDRINVRMDQMIEAGLFEEAEALYQYRDHNALQTVGYSEIFGFMEGQYDKTEAIRLLKRNSRRYAKRQLTWFRRYGDIHWFQPGELNSIKDLIESHFPD